MCGEEQGCVTARVCPQGEGGDRAFIHQSSDFTQIAKRNQEKVGKGEAEGGKVSVSRGHHSCLG